MSDEGDRSVVYIVCRGHDYEGDVVLYAGTCSQAAGLVYKSIKETFRRGRDVGGHSMESVTSSCYVDGSVRTRSGYHRGRDENFVDVSVTVPVLGPVTLF